METRTETIRTTVLNEDEVREALIKAGIDIPEGALLSSQYTGAGFTLTIKVSTSYTVDEGGPTVEGFVNFQKRPTT